jgi:hypothetical protein
MMMMMIAAAAAAAAAGLEDSNPRSSGVTGHAGRDDHRSGGKEAPRKEPKRPPGSRSLANAIVKCLTAAPDEARNSRKGVPFPLNAEAGGSRAIRDPTSAASGASSAVVSSAIASGAPLLYS